MKKFEVKSIVWFDNSIALGYATVAIFNTESSFDVNFIFEITKNNEYFFHYQNGIKLSDEDKMELENWFVFSA